MRKSFLSKIRRDIYHDYTSAIRRLQKAAILPRLRTAGMMTAEK
jgi:hypothetical protein